MNKLLSCLVVGIMLALSMPVIGQNKTHFDNKPYVENEMILQVTATADVDALIMRAPLHFELTNLKYLSKPMRVWLLGFNEEIVSAEAIQHWLYSQPEASIVDYNYLVQERETTPGDPSYNQQWHHTNTGQTGGTADADIDSDLAWDITTGGTTALNHDIVVCMVEGGGGNLNHQDLSPNRWINTAEIENNGIDDDGNGYIDDYNGWDTGGNNDNIGTAGHGTNCLGMIGAKGDNGLNVVGANWDVKLMVVDMGGGLSQANVIEAYTYPLVQRQIWNNSGGTEGAFVVATSASWGIDLANPNSYPLWCQFYDTLGVYGILNVGATTNANYDVDTQGDMPTGCTSPYMIGVGRTDDNDNTAGGYGDQTILLGAPGIDVVTTNGTTGITTTTGTSFACPLTAGVIGLAYSIPCTDFVNYVISDPQGGADLVLQAMMDGTDPKAQLANKFITGGRLNSRNTLDELMLTGCSFQVCGMDVVSTVSDPECSGMDDGSLSVNVSGGSPGYTYDWGAFGGDVDNIGSLGEGTYSVIITDASGCDTTIFYTINYQTTLDLNITENDVSCNGAGDGSAVALGGGSTGFNYQWNGGPANDTYANLGPGSYDVTATDQNGCEITGSATITEPPVLNVSFSQTTNSLLAQFTNGSSGATSYLWDFGDLNTATSYDAFHTYATPGTYTVCLTAYSGCGDDSTCQFVTVDNIGLGENLIELIQVYPNPARSSVNFEINGLNVSTIEIVDVVGKLIANVEVENYSATVNVSDFSNGTYFYKLLDSTGEILITEKLIVHK